MMQGPIELVEPVAMISDPENQFREPKKLFFGAGEPAFHRYINT